MVKIEKTKFVQNLKNKFEKCRFFGNLNVM